METTRVKGPAGRPSTKAVGRPGERGFTLIEASIALLILMFATMGAASLFVYAINYNSGAQDRALALAVAQQQMEKMRKTDFADVVTPAQPEPDIVSAGRSYSIVTTVDGSATLKRITIQVTPKAAGPNWVRNSVLLVTERSQGGAGTYYP
jgi:Tfp pilus assembly protein PilV